MEIKQGKTVRGFANIEFIDLYGSQCSIQKSSLATEDAIWFGCDDPNPQILAKDANKHNMNIESKDVNKHDIKCDQNTGWVKYPIPEEVLINTRMHLTRDQVKDILPILQKFVDTGEID